MKHKKKWGSLILAASSSPVRLEILKILDGAGPLPYTEIMLNLNLNPIRDAGKFVYHLRNLMDVDLITLDKKTKKYGITELGRMIVKLARDIVEYVESKRGRLLVRTSRLTIEEFDRNKIVRSLVKEAGVPFGVAQDIAADAEERLIKLKARYLTAPLIREFVNAILIEKGFEEYRHRLTRLGMPLHDVVKLLDEVKKSSLTVNRLEEQTGSSALSEYVLLNGVSRQVADAHLSGMIQINRISSWILKPDEVFHDLQYFFKRGLPDDPAPKSFREAVNLIEKLYRRSAPEISNSMTIDLLNVFLAPYVGDLNRKTVVETFKTLFSNLAFEKNKIPLTLALEVSLPKFLKNADAVGPTGNKAGIYQDYLKEIQLVTESLIDTVKGTNSNNPLFNVQVLFKVRNDADECLAKIEDVLELAGDSALPYFAVCEFDENVGFMSEGLRMGVDRIKDDWKGYLRTGNLGTVHINLPRIHYESKGREERFRSLLESSVKIAAEALKSKRDALKRIFRGHMLPVLSGNGEPYFSMVDAACTVSFVGLNEVVKEKTGNEVYEEDGTRYASRLLCFIRDLLKEIGAKYDLRIKLAQRSCNEGSERLARIDTEKYGKNVICAESPSSSYYTDIPLIPLSNKLPLLTRIEAEASMHKILDGGCLTLIPLKKVELNELHDLNDSVLKAGCKSYTYTMELSHCSHCHTISHGFLSTCPKCGMGHPTHLGRASSLLQPTVTWPESKLRSSGSWIYHGL